MTDSLSKNYWTMYFPLTEQQTQQIKSCLETDIPLKLSLTKQQLLGATETATSHFSYIPLTSLQWNSFEYCKANKLDLNIEISPHQMIEIAKVNYDMVVPLKHSQIKGYLNKFHIRKNIKI